MHAQFASKYRNGWVCECQSDFKDCSQLKDLLPDHSNKNRFFVAINLHTTKLKTEIKGT
jgi:hypothetical protein